MQSRGTRRKRAKPGATLALAAAAVAAVSLGVEPILGDERDADGKAERTATGQAAPGAGPSSEAALAAARAEFTAALRAVRAGANAAGGAADSALLRAYPLYPYLEAARLVRALDAAAGPHTAADDASVAFLERHGDAPVTRAVRRARLDSFARRKLWDAFLAEADRGTGDPQLRCLTLQARIALDDIEGIAPEIADVWLTGHRLPLDCEPVFEWLRGEGLMTADLVEERVRLLLENGNAGFARVIARRLPAERAAPWLGWADLIERPRDTLDRLIAAPATPLPDGALADGWQRLARNRPADALERFPAFVAAFGLDRDDTSRAALALALGLAWDRRPEALDVFEQVLPKHLDDYALGWLARAALWAGDFARAGDAIAAMSSAQRDETRWRYWAARVAEETGEHELARELYRGVLGTDNYYAAMAAARLGVPMTPAQSTVPVDEARVARLASRAPFVRARELLRVRMPAEAAAEWRYGSAALDADDGPQTIHLAMRWGWYDMAVATATSHRIFADYRLLYPTPYDDAVAGAAELAGVEPTLLYAVVRQESLYRADATSAAGALGLAQLLPDTAKRIARRLGRPEPSRADLLVPEINLTLAAAELRSLLDEFAEQLPLALAGYNAGSNAARRWLPARPLDADVWIENIPYNETRDYVQRVLWHSVVFAWLESGAGRDTRGWLASIEPPGGGDRDLHAER
ncbi:MAG TPA: transglycosylase SLT domain-containing protein [Gammaproteobacteria bacterium]